MFVPTECGSAYSAVSSNERQAFPHVSRETSSGDGPTTNPLADAFAHPPNDPLSEPLHQSRPHVWRESEPAEDVSRETSTGSGTGEHGNQPIELSWCGSWQGSGWIITTPKLQAVQKFTVPTVVPRRLADHDGLSSAYESSGGGQRERRWAKPTGHHSVEQRIGSVLVRIPTHHGNPVLPAKSPNHPLKKISAFGSAVQQGEPHVREIMGDDETRGPAAGPKVKHGLDGTMLTERSDETAGVSNHFRDRSRSQEAKSLSVLQGAQHIRSCRSAHGSSRQLKQSRQIKLGRR
jgi:hypothetical protein